MNKWDEIIDAIWEMRNAPRKDAVSYETMGAAADHARYCEAKKMTLPSSVIPHGGDICFEWNFPDGSTEIHTVYAKVKITRIEKEAKHDNP